MLDDAGNFLYNYNMDIEIFRDLCANFIEEYPKDFPNPSALIFGYKIDGQIIHVVCGTDGFFVYIITAYVPNNIKFEDDLKTRRG